MWPLVRLCRLRAQLIHARSRHKLHKRHKTLFYKTSTQFMIDIAIAPVHVATRI